MIDETKDYLENFLSNDEEKNDFKSLKNDVKEIKNNLKLNSNDSSEFINVIIDDLPCGKFYKHNTSIKIRAAKVSDIQAYSAIDENNYIDVVEKMNEMLSKCVKYIFPNGNVGSYKNIKDGDRLFLIFMIRELTFQNGNNLVKDATCDSCKTEVKIPFRATKNQSSDKTFEYHETPSFLIDIFNEDSGCYELIINDVMWRLAPPTIGIVEIFFGDMKDKTLNKKNLNLAFLKIIPYLLYDRDSITTDGILQKEKDFSKLSLETFTLLDQLVDSMTFGVKGLKTICTECGSEVHTDMTFPDGPKAIFVIPNLLERFIKK